LHPKPDRLPEQATALLGSPLLRDVPERWLLAWLYGGEVVDPPEEAFDPPTGALVVLSGSMALLDGGRELYHLERGDLFHSSFVPHLRHPRLRSTATWTRVLQLPETLYRACSDESGLQQVLERLYRSRTWWSLVTGEEPGLDTLAALSHLCRERHFHPGAVIVQQGDRANQFYIVTSGEVEVVHTDAGVARSVGKFGPGYHFGEIALLGRELRTASVRATLPTEVLELPSRAFENHLMEMPMARYLISRRAAQRRAELTGLTAPRQHPP
jgi:signal-transduction protein with cAMP-binding, CBS, and nucleotidyltransferase domain